MEIFVWETWTCVTGNSNITNLVLWQGNLACEKWGGRNENMELGKAFLLKWQLGNNWKYHLVVSECYSINECKQIKKIITTYYCDKCVTFTTIEQLLSCRHSNVCTNLLCMCNYLIFILQNYFCDFFPLTPNAAIYEVGTFQNTRA